MLCYFTVRLVRVSVTIIYYVEDWGKTVGHTPLNGRVEKNAWLADGLQVEIDVDIGGSCP